MTDEQVIGIIEKILSEKGFSDNAQTNAVSQSRQENFFPAQTENEQKQMETMLKQLEKQFEKRVACDRILKNRLNDSGLPEKAKDRIFNQFLAKTFETPELDRVIQEEKDYLASMSGPVFDLGNQTRSFAKTGSGPLDKLEIALDLAFGLDGQTVQKLNNIKRLDGRPFFHDGRIRAAQDYNGIAPLTGIAELYSLTTGDSEVRGFFNRDNLAGDLRVAQDITSSTFSYILKNTLGRRLVADYISSNYREDILISLKKPVKDFRQQEAVLVGYFDDLSTVDPETADYTEINPVSDEESTYTIAQKGNILTISRKTIINDDISLIKRLVSRLGRAARRTHAQYVWNFFIQNDFCSDGTRWFTSAHGNLGSSALSFSEALTAYKALAKMTEKDSGKPIGLLDDPSRMPLLVYPVDLMETAGSIVNDDFYYSSNDLTTKTRNPLKGKIEGAQISLLTDANDWGLLMPTEAIDMVEMGYLNGRQEPELFLADTPQNEQVFVADKLRYKIRHEYAGAVIDFRSGYKAQVA
jgi:hypothetical protein